MSYEEVHGDIASQRGTIASQRETIRGHRTDISGTRRQILQRRSQWGKPVVGGTAKQRRVAMRSVVRTPEHRAYVSAKKTDIAAMGKAEVEMKEYEGTLTTAEQELSEYESSLADYETQVKQYESEGYTVSKDAAGELQFIKKTYTPGKRVQVGVRPTSVYVYWRNRTSGETGRFQGSLSKIGSYRRQLDVTNRDLTSYTTVGGGEPIYDTTKGYWTSKDIVLAKAEPIYETVQVKLDEKKIGDLSVSHIGMDKSVNLGFDRKTYEVKSVDIETQLGRQLGLTKTETFKGITESRIVGYEKIKDLPDRYAWTKGELKKIDKAYETNIVLGAVSEFGFGITSSFAGSIQSVHSLFGYKPKHEYISILDAYLDPAAKEIYKERPILYYGGSFGEATQVVAFLAGPSAVKTGVVSGTKFVVRKTPKFVSKLKGFTGVSKPLLQSEAMLFEGGLKAIGRKPTLLTKTFGKVETLGRTQFWSNITGWSKGELVFAKAYPVAKGYPKVYSGDDVYAKLIKYKGFGRRVLVSPKVVAREKVGRSLIHTYRGISGKELRHTTVYKSISKPKGFFRKEIKQTYISAAEGTAYQKIIDPTGGEFIRPFLSKEARSIPVARLTRKGFFESTEASARLVPTVTIPRHVSTMGVRGIGSLGREPLMLSVSQLPSYISVFTPITVAGVRTLSVAGQDKIDMSQMTQIQRSIQQQELLYKQMVDTRQEQLLLPSSMQMSANITRTIQKQQQKQLRSYKLETQQIYQPRTKTIKQYIKSSSGTVIKPPYVVPFKLPELEGDVKKRKKKTVEGYGMGYRFRRWKVPTMKDILGVK